MSGFRPFWNVPVIRVPPGPFDGAVSSTGQRPTYHEDRAATENVTPPRALFVGELFRVDDLSAGLIASTRSGSTAASCQAMAPGTALVG
jgi:hypothetical protein